MEAFTTAKEEGCRKPMLGVNQNQSKACQKNGGRRGGRGGMDGDGGRGRRGAEDMGWAKTCSIHNKK